MKNLKICCCPDSIKNYSVLIVHLYLFKVVTENLEFFGHCQ